MGFFPFKSTAEPTGGLDFISNGKKDNISTKCYFVKSQFAVKKTRKNFDPTENYTA